MDLEREHTTYGYCDVAAIILAAGLARRMGFPKLLMEVAGKSIIRHVVEAAMATRVQQIILVTGPYVCEMANDMPWDERLIAVYNPRYAEGQSTSLAAGLHAVPAEFVGAVVLLGDQPGVSPQAIDAVINRFAAHRPAAVITSYNGHRGHPVLFGRSLFPELMAVQGDKGGREVLAAHAAEVEEVQLPYGPPPDVDTLRDYQRLVRSMETAQASRAFIGLN